MPRHAQPALLRAIQAAPSAAWVGFTASLVLIAALASVPAPARAATVAETSPAPPGDSEVESRSRALQRAHEAVLGVQVRAVEDGRTLQSLGRERSGSGVLIDHDGRVLTISYLLLEAEEVMLLTHDGRQVPARVLAVDVATGLGLVQALAPLALEPAALARGPWPGQEDIAARKQAAPLRAAQSEPLLAASGEPDANVQMVQLAGARAYSASWEYHLDEALFTTPPLREMAGAGLFNLRGELLGIGSLRLPDVSNPGEAARPGNLFVPVALLQPVLQELLALGRSRASERAWLGLNCAERDGVVRVVRVSEDSPAELAGLEPGDRVLAIDGRTVRDLATLWKTLWAVPAAQRAVEIEILRDGRPRTLTVHSIDRSWALRRPAGI